ncbi:MAG: tRNA (adenosine(37)-N6)-threonylcarbamoyltransferase complex ATPase subunit type 1 TsaE [Pirellulaceae bacterium]|nr:tRNA (adenosine(37)-N6)-threonylcarbamoyltransferase complex ATPase subunit type 1 TsaE [Pirellulaceae bacterium]
MPTFYLSSLSETEQLATSLATVLTEPKEAPVQGITIALSGTLGAGKTQFVKFLAKALHVPSDQITSPTFVLAQTYHGSRKLVHLDTYRLRDEEEFLELGVEEFFESEAIVLIEWAEKVAACLPEDHLALTIDLLSPTRRAFQWTSHGKHSGDLLKRLCDQFIQDGFEEDSTKE